MARVPFHLLLIVLANKFLNRNATRLILFTVSTKVMTINHLKRFFVLFQTRHQLEKLLDWENSHLYHKLGLHWKLARQRCDSTLMMEYVRSL